MNCPHHHKLFAALPRSYRELPLRFAEYGFCHRYEQSGELFGLMRVRSLQMNDAHIYCTPEQFESEFNAVNQMYLRYFKLFGIDKYVMRFSTHDPAKLGQKFVDEPELWKQTEAMTRKVLKSSGINFIEVPNEAAFYGPKIDVQVGAQSAANFPSRRTRSTLLNRAVSISFIKIEITPRRRRSAFIVRRLARTNDSSDF